MLETLLGTYLMLKRLKGDDDSYNKEPVANAYAIYMNQTLYSKWKIFSDTYRLNESRCEKDVLAEKLPWAEWVLEGFISRRCHMSFQKTYPMQIVQTFDKPMLDDSKKKTFIHHVQLLIGKNEN